MFDIDSNNNVILKEPGVLLISEFKKIWDTDKTKDKDLALKIFAYIYFKSDFKSPYRNSKTVEELPEVLKRDLNLPKDFKETEDMKLAEAKYIDLQTTKSLKMILSAEKSLDQITKYFADYNIELEEDKSASISKLMSNLKQVDEVATKLEFVKDKIAKELQTKRLSGTKVLSSRELPKNKRK
jgi:hypothetical protein